LVAEGFEGCEKLESGSIGTRKFCVKITKNNRLTLENNQDLGDNQRVS
jgi:hypothetical protein